jgi:hypothetical protein
MKVSMKNSLKYLFLLLWLSSQAQLTEGDLVFSTGFSAMQTDLGSTASKSFAGNTSGYFVNLDYYLHVYELFDYRDDLYNALWGHLMLKGGINFSHNDLKYDRTDNVDPIFTGDLPGTTRIQGHTDVYGIGVGIEYHINNLTRYYANRAKFKFSPFIGFGLQYNLGLVNTNARLNYDIVYGNGDGVIDDSEVPISAADVLEYNLDYNLNPIPANKMRGSFEQYAYNSTAQGSPRQTQLIRYGGMNRPTTVNAFSFNLSAGSRFYLSNRWELAALAEARFYSSDDLDGLNMPIKPNQKKESLFNATVSIIYHIFR